VALCAGNTVDGFYNSGIVRYLHTTYTDTCSVGTGMSASEQRQERSGLIVQDGALSVSGLTDGLWPFSAFDLSGRVVLIGALQSAAGRTDPVRVSQLSPGLYVLRLPGVTSQVFSVR
ncbi:MAG: T9SS type A sorting domain-containing protein, partial [Flavobacteriales bacterium]